MNEEKNEETNIESIKAEENKSDELVLKNAKSTKAEVEVPEEKEEICRVLYTTLTKIAIDFKGFGIEVPITEDIKTDSNLKEIKIYYTSDIGQADFKHYLKAKE